MTAFLFIPATADAKQVRRVDLANFASLFADVEDLKAPPSQRTLVMRLLAFLMIVVIAIGDTILVARPYALTHTLPGPGAPTSEGRAVTSL